MRKKIRKFFLYATSSVISCVAIFAGIFLFFNFNYLRPQIEAQTTDLLEQKVRITGDIKPSFLNWHLALVMHKVDVGTDIKADAVTVSLPQRTSLQRVMVQADNLKYKGQLLGDYDIPVTVYPDGFEIDPLKGNQGGSTFKGKVKYINHELHIEGTLKDFPLGRLADEAEGKVDGIVQLEGRGETQAELIRTLKGRLMLTSGTGKLTSKSLNFWSRDLLTSFLPGKKEATTLNCAIVDFNVIGNGQAQSRAIVVDTSENTVFAKGTIDFDKGQVDMVLKPHPKDISLVSVATPVHISGAIDNATVTPEAGGVARKIGGVLLGVINPALAVLPIVEEKLGDYNGSCADILKQYQTKNVL